VSDEAAKHAILLDALEAAGFPRSSLVGAGNAIVWKLDGGSFTACTEGTDKMNFKTETAARVLSSMNIPKDRARQLGAFLLAWGHAP
jgi:hypothetical protein